LQQDETLIISALRNGNTNAIEQFVDEYKSRVYNTVLGMVHNAEDAEELAQDVFVKALQTIETFKGDAKLSTWLYRIAVNKSLDHIKKGQRKKRFAFLVSINSGSEDSPAPNPASFIHPGWQLENKELGQQLFKAIDQLADKQKTALTLNKIEGLSYEQTAEVMEVTVSSVESLIFRARQNLKKLMSNYLKKD
jgi:RNA polymerase sigma-70 factor (ECF subfamily)